MWFLMSWMTSANALANLKTMVELPQREDSRMNMLRIKLIFLGCLTTLFCVCPSSALAFQGISGPRFEVNESVESLDIIAGSARRLKFAYQVPELMVENPEVIQASPVSPNEILVTGLKPGVSSITISDPDKNLQTIAIEVLVDTRKLELAFSNYFPDSQIKVHPLNSGVILAGHVARADQVANILKVAADYFPTNVVNQLQVNGNQNIAIKVEVYEVSRTKLRELGVDWAVFAGDIRAFTSISDILSISTDGELQTSNDDTFSFGVLDDGEFFQTVIRALEQNNVAKLLDQPVLVAQNGRPAEFLSGGEIPIQTAAGLGSTQVEFRPFGTKLDMVPIVHGNGELTLEVRAEVSEVAPDLANNGIPGFRVRRVNTGVKMRAGHTLALAGDYREISSTENRGIPGIKHSPFLGPLFRTVSDEVNETELVFLITPRFVSDVEPSQLPVDRPGRLTTSPSNHELYVDGYTEVPRCNDDCPVNDSFAGGQAGPAVSFQGGGIPQGFNQGFQGGYPAPQVPQFQPQQGFGPSGSASRQAPQAPPVRHANSGFAWPTSSRTR